MIDRIVDLLARRPASLGRGRLLCIEGPAGSGKTTLAAGVGARTGAPVLHMDDLYDGWTGLPRVGDPLAGLLGPLSRDEPGQYRRYDWAAARHAEAVSVLPTPLLVLEGVGAGHSGHQELITALIWVEAPRAVRRERGLRRDGPEVEPFWDDWTRAEEQHFREHRTRSRADLVIDGVSGTQIRRP